MAVAGQRMTADEYLALPPTDENRRLELIDGEFVANAPTVPHQRVVIRLVTEIGVWIRQGAGRGELLAPDVFLSDRDVFSPDLVWVPAGYDYPADDGALRSPPSLVVEVCSPSTWRHDRGHKRRHYEAAGVLELWLVDHVDGAVEVHRRSSPTAATFDDREVLTAGDTLTTALLPGVAIDVTALLSSAVPES